MPIRLSLTQLLLIAALCALVAGLVGASWRTGQMDQPLDVKVSPDGKTALVVYMFNKHRVYDLSTGRQSGWLINAGRGFGSWFPGSDLELLDGNTVIFTESQVLSNGLPGSRMVRQEIKSGRRLAEVKLPYADTVYCLPAGDGAVTVDNAGDVKQYDAQGELVRKLNSSSTSYNQLRVSADGTVVSVASFDEVDFWNLQTGKRLAQLREKGTGGYFVGGVLSPNGQRYAVPGQSPSDPSRSTLTVWETQTGKRIRTIRVDGWAGWGQPVFTPDGGGLLVSSYDKATQLIDIASGKEVGRLKDGGADSVGVIYRFLPDGKRLIGVGGQEIAIWDLETGRRVHVLWNRHWWLQVCLFVAAFCGWATVWGLAAHRARQTFSEQHEQPPEAAGQSNVPPIGSAIAAPTRTRAFLWLVAGAIFAGALVLISVGMVPGTFRAVAVVVAVVLLPIVIISVVFGLDTFRRVILKSFQADIGRAMRLSGTEGQVIEFADITAWLTEPSVLAPVLQRELAGAERRFSDLSGELNSCNRLLILEFDRERPFEDYLGRRLPLAGVHVGLLVHTLMICRQRCRELLIDPLVVFRTLLGYQLTRQWRSEWLEPWLQGVVNQYLEAREYQTGSLAGFHRVLQAADQRGETVDPRWVFGVTQKELLGWATSLPARESFRQLTLFKAAVVSMTAYLLRDASQSSNGEPLAALMKTLRHCKNRELDTAIRQHLGVSLPQWGESWAQWRQSQTVETFEPASPFVSHYLLKQTIPTALVPQQELAERRQAIRALGSSGDLRAAETLIGLVEELKPNDELLLEAVWSLQSISGRALGTSASDWRQWWSEVQPLVNRSPSESAQAPTAAEMIGDEQTDDSRREEVQCANDRQPQSGKPADSPAADGAISADDLPALRRPHTETDAGIPPVVTTKAVHAAHQRSMAVPGNLKQVWVCLGIGGAIAIVISVCGLLSAWWWIPAYYSLGVGVASLAAGVACTTRRLGLLGGLLMGNLVNCDVIGFVLGLLTLTQSRDATVTMFLRNRQT